MSADREPPPGPSLPSRRTRFFGRGFEVEDVIRRLEHAWLVTLIGPPGSGKSRLSVEVGAELAVRSDADVRVIALASVSDEREVAGAVAAGLGVVEEPGTPVEDSLVAHLRSADLLLVLDNCEHVVAAAAELVDRVLTDCPGVRVLATSRISLALPGEQLFRVQPLDEDSAVELFVDRSGLVTDRVFDDADRQHVAAICRRLDCLPLAVELAAPWTRVLAPDGILQRLDTALPLLSGTTGVLTHQRTMEATIAWSCRLLSAREQLLFDRLSVFVGGFDFDAVEAVAGTGSDLLGQLTALVDHSLVLAEPNSPGAMRYRMLEPVREYGGVGLADRGETDAIRGRHAEHYLAVVRRCDAGLGGPDGLLCFDVLGREEGNLMAALSWARRRPSDLALRFVTLLGRYWGHRGYVRDARERVEGLLEHGAPSPRLRAAALFRLGQLAYRQSDYAAACSYYRGQLCLMSDLGDERGRAQGLRGLAQAVSAGGDARLAVDLCEQSLELFRALGDTYGQAWVLSALGLVHYAAGEVGRGAEVQRTALKLLETTGELTALAGRAHLGLAFAAAVTGDAATHRTELKSVIEILRCVGGLAGDQDWMWASSTLAASEGRVLAALRLAGAANALGSLGSAMPPVADDLSRSAVERAAEQVGARAAARLMSQGAAMTVDDLTMEALAPPTAADRPLSSREIEVAELIGRGLGNEEIARELFISRRTVESHQEHLKQKLDLPSRYEIMAWALANRLEREGASEESG